MHRRHSLALAFFLLGLVITATAEAAEKPFLSYPQAARDKYQEG